jgi:hypothetical protein
MRPTDVVTATVEVAVNPATAFAIFTEEIGRWWRPGPINWNDSRRAVGVRFEPGVGGRWIEVHDEATGEGFEAIDGGTRVTLEHRGWDKVLLDIAARKREIKRWGWANILGWFSEWAFWGSPRRIQGSAAASEHY